MDNSSLQMPPPNYGSQNSQSPRSPRSPRSPTSPGLPPLPSVSVPQRRPSSSPHPQREQEGSAALPQRRSSGNNSAMSIIEASVTKLLVSTKSLLEGLTAWSQNKASEKQVSDIYVKLVNEFNTVCQVFERVNVEISDLTPIPEKLRTCLEKALDEEASPHSLQVHLPKIRDVIITLLQGLKAKQMIHRQRTLGDLPSLPRQNSTSSSSSTGSSRIWSPPTSPRPDEEPQTDGLNADGEQPKRTNSGSMTDSLAALKRSDVIGRRASKRFSAYTMQKIAREVSRRAAARGGHENLAKSLPPSRLSATQEEDENAQAEKSTQAEGSLSTQPVQGQEEPTEQKAANEEKRRTEDADQSRPTLKVEGNLTPDIDGPSELTLFLQVGKDVKKVRYDGDLSIPALRVLFIEKFSYNPGMDNFPEIYVKDKETGVMYELEDMSEVKNNSVLALNIETIEQIKKHFDQSISALTQELKDVKKSFAENNELLRRGNVLSTANSPRPTPTEMQFREAARKVLASVKQKDEEKKGSTQSSEAQQQQQSQQSGRDQPGLERLANDLKTQYDEVQNLRRDLGAVRQLYSDFQEDTQRTLRELGERTSAVKQFAFANVSSARSFIDSGKTKVDTRSRELLKRVEELQDTVDELKLDITQRKCRPRETGIEFVKKESAALSGEIAEQAKYIASVKPMWKKTWEEELQNIVEEQKFLNHQEELMEDLEEDYASVMDIYKHILKVIEIQSKTRTKKEFRVAPPEEGFEGIKTVMVQVRGIEPDSEKRLRALYQAERQRSRDLASRIDEFEAELTDFVAQSKLKKTGGAQEADRLRQKRDEETRKAMFKSLNTDS